MDFTITLTVIIAVIAFVSPIFVAIINNVHHSKIRKMELQNQLEQKQFETYYFDKEKAYAQFSHDAGKFLSNAEYAKAYEKLYSSIYTVMLLCDQSTQSLLVDFMNHVNQILIGTSKTTQTWEEEYLKKLSALTTALNTELYSTAKIISKLYKPKTKLQLLSHIKHRRKG